jgi:hypothetical protein
MPDLIQALATGPGVKWLIARVTAITTPTITITYRGGDVTDVGVLDQYVPAVGDVVHILASDLNGFLAIGSNNQGGTITPPTVQPSRTATASDVATYRISTLTWTVGTLQESPDLVGIWLYPPAQIAAAHAALPIARLTIRITATDAVPLEFVLHRMTSASGPLTLVPGAAYRTGAPPVGVPTDIPLPLGWATLLTSGLANGVGVGGGDYATTLTGSSGLLAFTPL